MADNFRHAQYRTDGTQIDDPQLLTGLSQSQVVALQGVVSGDGFPAGGGGSTNTGATSGAGARGQCNIWGVV